ncbi:MAG: S-adenosylmethionine:tRNA ribosyltransferase-isomerase [Candidatus Kapabacteria bacterium]|nr:S-adenosylmethionine:tRNA ribosyltransferase-isomerase [Candidatus Kapabacteria bacterium]
MIPKIELNDYKYELPEELIALYPTKNRGESRLLKVDKKLESIEHFRFDEITELLPEDSLFFLNETKVISARILMQKLTGAKIELLLFEPLNKQRDFQIGLSDFGESNWKCIVGGKINVGSILKSKIEGKIKLKAEVLEKNGNELNIRFFWDDRKISFSEVLIEYGNIPLPPYIKRNAIESDSERYQTVFANIAGSVAAPTAALHFNELILSKISDKNIDINKLTLHVGLGTFKPINCNYIEDHKMHNEPFNIYLKSLKSLLIELQKEKPLITSTGTTSTRTLESIYWIGVKLILNKEIDINYAVINQWDSYSFENKGLPSPEDSISKVIIELEKNGLNSLNGQTELIIVPGYKFKIINGLITNFHAPHSTLILLIAAFLGKDLWKRSYQSAIMNKYKFLSYGDSSYLTK